jgi:hypothetical protein
MTKQASEVRAKGLRKVDEIVKALPRLKELRAAFTEWQSGEVFVGKTGVYRYRHGKKTMQPTPWSEKVQAVFSSPGAFAFAAMVIANNAALIKPQAPPKAERANVIALAKQEKRAA